MRIHKRVKFFFAILCPAFICSLQVAGDSMGFGENLWQSTTLRSAFHFTAESRQRFVPSIPPLIFKLIYKCMI